MLNPSDLEGEVDHSFFDSDCDAGSGDGGKKMEKDFKAKKQSLSAHDRLQAKQTENTKGGWSPRTDGTENHLKPVKGSSRAERKENNWQSKEKESSRASSVSSAPCTTDRVNSNRSDSEEDSYFHFKRPSTTFLGFLAEAREVDYKDSQSPDESEEEALPPSFKQSGSKGRNKQSPKKRRNRRTRSPSPTSTEASVDADSESSCSSSERRSSSDSHNRPRLNKSSLSPRVRRSRVGSAGSQDVPASHTEESDDTVTDVSPLSSPDFSPLQSLDLNHTEDEEGSHKEQQRQLQQEEEESVPSSGNFHQDEDSDQAADDCSLSSESRLGGKLVFHCPGGRNRKNYSFTNDEVRCIDRENQRLLRELSRISPGLRPGSTAGKKSHVASNSPLIRLSHSALNRQREQQRIERENLAFLKRLESVKPTPGLKRSEQLADYQRHVEYLGAPSYPICMATTKKERSSSKTSSAGSRPMSSAHHSSRAVSTPTGSGNASVPRSRKPNVARPAWC